jgi:predicted phosphate transport protein (TIGR00153 family)
MVFNRKETEVDALIVEHFTLIGHVLKEFYKMMTDYFHQDKSFKEDAYQVHTIEHEADKVRRKIAEKLHEGAFLPIFREDYLILVERMDKIANRAESTCDLVVLTRPRIPEFLVQDFSELVDVTTSTFDPLKEAIQTYQKDYKRLMEAAHQIRLSERKIDQMVWNITKKLFKSKLDKAEKLHLKQLIDAIADISDRIEDGADKLEAMEVKRQL